MEDILNDNRSQLIELCEDLSLKITNGFFPHKNIHRCWGIQPIRRIKSMNDYIIIKQKPFLIEITNLIIKL